MGLTVSKTYRLNSATVEAIQALVGAGIASSPTGLLELLITREKTRLDMHREDEALESAWTAAMASEEYRAEMDEISQAFAGADAESARLIP